MQIILLTASNVRNGKLMGVPHSTPAQSFMGLLRKQRKRRRSAAEAPLYVHAVGRRKCANSHAFRPRSAIAFEHGNSIHYPQPSSPPRLRRQWHADM